MKNRNRFTYLLLLTFLVFTLMGCKADNTDNFLKELSQTLGVDVSSGEILTQSDDHGGFHGDGSTVVEIRFADTGLAEQIEGSADWTSFPLTDNLTALIYGLHTEESSIGPMIHGGMMPQRFR